MDKIFYMFHMSWGFFFVWYGTYHSFFLCNIFRHIYIYCMFPSKCTKITYFSLFNIMHICVSDWCVCWIFQIERPHFKFWHCTASECIQINNVFYNNIVSSQNTDFECGALQSCSGWMQKCFYVVLSQMICCTYAITYIYFYRFVYLACHVWTLEIYRKYVCEHYMWNIELKYCTCHIWKWFIEFT